MFMFKHQEFANATIISQLHWFPVSNSRLNTFLTLSSMGGGGGVMYAPYMKILDFSQFFVADAPVKKKI